VDKINVFSLKIKLGKKSEKYMENIKNLINVLLVEDNEADVRLTQEALKECKMIINLEVVMDGVEAMNFLFKKGKYRTKSRPDLIILDLNLPKKDGREVLADIKQNDTLKRIPVVILTTSKSDEDILKTYNLHANCFVTKPLDLDQFIEIVKKIEDFWFTIVRLPDGV
jgi:two-component system response regulator